MPRGKNQLDKALVVTDSMLKDGFPALQILTQLVESVVVSKTCDDTVKARVALRVAEVWGGNEPAPRLTHGV